MSFFSRRNRDGGENKEPEEEKKAQPARPFSSTRIGGDNPARPGGGSGGDDRRSTSERDSPFSRSSMFSRSSDNPEKKDDSSSDEPRARPAGLSGRTNPPADRSGNRPQDSTSRFGIRSPSEGERRQTGENPSSGRTTFGGGIRRNPEDRDERKDSESSFGSRYSSTPYRREMDERKESGESTSRYGSGLYRQTTDETKDEAGSGSRLSMFRRGGTEDKTTEKKDETSGSRFGGLRRSPTEEKKDEASGSRFGGLRRSPTEEKKDETSGSRLNLFRRGGTEDKTTERKDEASGSRFGGLRRSPTEEKKDEASGSRFGGLRRSPTEEKKDEASGSRFGGLRRSPTEEKKDETSGSRLNLFRRGGTEDKTTERKDEASGSRFGGLRRSPTEERRDAPTPPSARSSSMDRSATSSITRSTGVHGTATPAKPGTDRPRPKSNRAAAKPLPTGKDRLPKLVKAGPSLDFQLDMLGGVLVVAAFILLSGFFSPGKATGVIDSYLAQLFGIGRLLVPFVLGGVGAWLLVSRFGNVMFDIEYFRIFGVVLLLIVVMATLQWGYLFSETVPSYTILEQNSDTLWRDGEAGGIVGHVVYIFFARQLGDYAVVVFFFFWWVFALMLVFKTSPSQLVEQGRNVRHSLQVRREAARARHEAKKADIPALAAAAVAEATAPPAALRAPQETVGRTTTPEQDQVKAAETSAAPARQTPELSEEKPSRMGRLFRGGKVETEPEPRVTSEEAQEQRKRLFGLPGRRISAQTAEPASEETKVEAEKSVETSEASSSGRLGLFGRRRQPEEAAKTDEKSSERVEGRRLGPDKAESSTGKDEAASSETGEAKSAGYGRLGMGRLLNRPAPESTESALEKPVESASPQESMGSRLGLGMLQRSKPTDSTTDEKPAAPEAAEESGTQKRFLGGIASRWAGRKTAEESDEKPEGKAPESKPSPDHPAAGVRGRLAAVRKSPEEAVPPAKETVEPKKEPDVLAESGISSRLSEMRARRLAASNEPTADSPFGRRPISSEESSERKDGEYPRRHMPSREMSSPFARRTADETTTTEGESEEEPTQAEKVEAPEVILSEETKNDDEAPDEISDGGSRRSVEQRDLFTRRLPANVGENESTTRDPFRRREIDRPMGLRRLQGSTTPEPAETAEEAKPEALPAAESKTEIEEITTPGESTETPPAVQEEVKPAQARGMFIRRFQQSENTESAPITTEQHDAQIDTVSAQPEEKPVSESQAEPPPAEVIKPVVEEAASNPEPASESKVEVTAAPPPVMEAPEEDKPQEWKLPEFMTVLEPGSDQEIDQHYLLEQARIIEDTLSSFGAPGKVVEVNSGPVITQFGVEPDYIERRGGRTRVKVSAIAALEKDIALALAAKTIRVEAPVPGKGFVGIEVPNAKAALVSLRDVMTSNEHQRMQQKSPLAIGLGQAVDGAPISADLTAMPHLLIAGTTGSGKSVCVNAIISCLLLQNTPTELQMIMVDPKRVELTGYNGIPHLISNVVVDLERIVGVLKWVQREMDERYRKLNERGARNIQEYNRRAPDGSKIPYLIVIIDELADLMMLAPDETEKLIARLAQMARATGIHLIISTQRPSVDVVTGLIKANFPARIAFAVASGTDSRVILDAPGADRLLGKGDMLFQAPDASAPVRMQGVYVSDVEIEKITRYWKEQAVFVKRSTNNLLKLGDESHRTAQMPVSRTERFGSEIHQLPRPERQQTFWKEVDELAAESINDDADDGDDDDMYEEAVNIVRQLEKASTSLLQRRLRIGYTRAARLIDLMETRGVIGPAESGSKPRDVLQKFDE
ncbi:MAG: hypothetical protein KJ064_26180 [Anaerolineae bacterium]|nr:hypothetical protein [Anaerolineae bacterium]